MKKIILFIAFLQMAWMADAQIQITDGTSLKVVSGGSMTITGDLASDNGTLDNQGTVKLKGKLENNTSALFSSTSSGTFIFEGSTQQEITGNADAGFRGTTVVNNASGVALTSASTGSSQSVNGELQLTSGKLILNQFDLNIASTDPTGAGASSYIVTNSTGSLKREVPADGTTAVTFPVGNASYNPVVLSGDATATTDTYSVRVLDNEPANDSTNGFVDRSWVVGEETAGGSELTVTSQWNGSNELTGFDRTNSAVGLTTDGGMNYLWALYGAAAGSDPYTQTGSGFSSVGTFAVATNLDPIGHWPMDDLSGTTVTDVSGNNLDGLRVNGSDWSTNGKIDGAASFDGINDYAEIPDDDLLDPGADDFTVSFWVYKREATLGWDNAWGVNKWNTGGSPGTNEFSLALTAERNSDKPMFVIESGNTKYSAVSPEEISLNEWHLLTGVREGSQIKLYVDGQLKQTTNVGSASVNNLGISLRIANSQMNKHYADAMIDDVRFYDFALSETKIEELFTSVNNAPVVDAGEDQTIISPVNTANLSGSVVDDGLPADSSLTIEWSLVSGPGNVVFADSSQPITTATFSAEGVYLLELAASDGELTSSDTMEVAVLSKAPPPSPIGHWPMDDLTGTTVTDVSGNNLDGELINGAQWTTNGIINGAASFDGINDYAEIPDDELLDPGADDFTVSFWVYKREPTLGWDNVWGVNKWNTGAAGGTNEWTLSLAGSSNSDHAAFIIESGTTLFSAKSPDDIPLNEWHLITGVRENDEIKLYVDSVLKATTFIGNVSVNNVGRKVRIANSQLNNHYTDGMFDDVRIYDVALNSDEVDSLFNLGAMNKRLPVAATIEVLSDLRIYPNPVLTTTTIDFNLQATERVTMGIFDERGQLVEMLVDDNLPEGTHRMKWDASPVSRGVYILRAMVGQQLYHKKIVKQ